ncbi:hypothetical protein Dda_0991 [Drechslerella dactyloides]|uniref:Uncharacterized protein n=1 Tax=Drechslerella dactyloides TaxID=74499 RepID=A0AAD6J5A7_DREDA|nr:hypothetical protein Dda_0991 [Drechslerella dactyloides]
MLMIQSFLVWMVILATAYQGLTAALTIPMENNSNSPGPNMTKALNTTSEREIEAFININARTPELQAETSSAVSKRGGDDGSTPKVEIGVRCGTIFSISDIIAGATERLISQLDPIPGFDFARLVFPNWGRVSTGTATRMIRNLWASCMFCKCTEDGYMVPDPDWVEEGNECSTWFQVYTCMFVYAIIYTAVVVNSIISIELIMDRTTALGCSCYANYVEDPKPPEGPGIETLEDIAYYQIPDMLDAMRQGGKSSKSPSAWGSSRNHYGDWIPPRQAVGGVKEPYYLEGRIDPAALAVSTLLWLKNYAYDRGMERVGPGLNWGSGLRLIGAKRDLLTLDAQEDIPVSNADPVDEIASS